jgi:hypothetical protein
MIEAFADLLYGFMQYLKDGLFDHFLVNAPQPKGEEKIYLAAISIRDREVYRVCNFTRRRYVKSFPLVGYWTSVVPFMPFLKQWFTRLACTVLPDHFRPYEVNIDEPGPDRISLETIMQAVAWAQSSDISGRVREVRKRTRVATGTARLAATALRPAPRPVGGRTLLVNDVVGKQSDAATEIATAKGLAVETRPFTAGVAARSVAGVFRTARAGDQLTLFTDESGAVRSFEITNPAPVDTIATTTVPPDVAVLQNQLTQAQTQLNQTLIQLTTLQTQQVHRDTEMTQLRTQLADLSLAHDQLRTDVGNINPNG